MLNLSYINQQSEEKHGFAPKGGTLLISGGLKVTQHGKKGLKNISKKVLKPGGKKEQEKGW